MSTVYHWYADNWARLCTLKISLSRKQLVISWVCLPIEIYIVAGQLSSALNEMEVFNVKFSFTPAEY